MAVAIPTSLFYPQIPFGLLMLALKLHPVPPQKDTIRPGVFSIFLFFIFTSCMRGPLGEHDVSPALVLPSGLLVVECSGAGLR